ncbi:MAG TPA: helix-turn-helix transcriptional regulator [Kineosporiaceae bacterium]
MASISDRVGDLGEYLREQREHARLSVRQLATLAGVSNPYLSQVERGLRKPSAEVLQQIARGLRISAEALYVRAGILDQEGRPDVEVAIHADPELTERQRSVLLDIYASFRAENRRSAGEPVAPGVTRRRSAAATAAERTTARVRSRQSRTTTASASAASAAQAEAGAEEAAADSAAAAGAESAGSTKGRRTTTRRAASRAPRPGTTRSTRAARGAAVAGESPPSDDEA